MCLRQENATGIPGLCTCGGCWSFAKDVLSGCDRPAARGVAGSASRQARDSRL